jgi:hypothetical protein
VVKVCSCIGIHKEEKIDTLAAVKILDTNSKPRSSDVIIHVTVVKSKFFLGFQNP